ncbi:hypothetical protein PV11_07001 [Exophiala sideris]|uniref:Mediator of RNA polymerase II transcription subunit 16 n=1 Tax=Exophiala sideris TaxID=1016849 RepID=A0A0D1YF28_9EURO|nr:hypothetical protein PV11_07001 [Exophiala sideris]
MEEDLADLDQSDQFASEAFFNQNSLQQQIQQLDPINNLGASANVTPATNPALLEQLQRRWYCGCLARVAWSRHGHIATISNDGSNVHIECIRYDGTSHSYKLHDRLTLPTLFEDAVCLAWSAHGGELAIIDGKGRIFIYHTSLVAINSLTLARSGSLDQVSDTSQPIGVAWLNQDRQDRPKNVVLHATKNDTRWTHNNARAKPLAPYWARALLLAHRNGMLTLCFQRTRSPYAIITQRVSTSDDTLYSHASFAPTVEGRMLIAFHSLKGQISISLLSMDWSGVGEYEGFPVFSLQHVPNKVSARPSGSPTTSDLYDPDAWILSHLEVLHSPEVEKMPQAPPAILAVSSGINRSINITDPGYLVSSMIQKWTVATVEQELHPLFADLPSKGSGNTGSRSVITLQGNTEKNEQLITTIHQVDGHQALIVTTQENRTDFLSSEDLSSVSYAASATETSSMAQSGFTFPFTPDLMCPGFSPNACVRADIGQDDKTQITAMENQFGQIDPEQTLDPNVDAAVAALNLAFARACWSNATIDDVLMCALQTIPSELAPMVVSSMYRTLFRDTEFINEKTQGSELERIFHKQVMGRVMAYHASLTAYCRQLPSISSTDGREGWSLSAQWAWVANNIRYTATLLFMNLRDLQNANVQVSQDFSDMLCSNIRWGLGVIRFMISAILEVGDRETNPEMFGDKGHGRLGDTAGDGTQGLIALLLNIHCSRIFLVAFIRAVRAYAKNTEPRTRHQLQMLQCIQQQTTGKGITFQAIEAMFEYRWAAQGDVEGDVAATTARQLEMMATGVVFESYQPTIKILLTKLFNSPAGLRAKMLVDRLKLFTDQVDVENVFLNHDVLGAHADDKKRKPVIYDVHRKKPILKGVLEPGGTGEPVIRRCIRCGSFSADIVVPPPDWSKTVSQLLSKCICDGQWVIEPWKKYADAD